jgi:hypothetical protein
MSLTNVFETVVAIGFWRRSVEIWCINFEGAFEKLGAFRLTIVDLLISLGSAGLAVFSLPTVLNRASQVPRRTASIPTAVILTYFVPLFAISGLVLTSITIAGQAVVWWLIVAYRPVKKSQVRIDRGPMGSGSG